MSIIEQNRRQFFVKSQRHTKKIIYLKFRRIDAERAHTHALARLDRPLLFVNALWRYLLKWRNGKKAFTMPCESAGRHRTGAAMRGMAALRRVRP